jgi:superfamily I DNA/RNA helicase
MSVPARAISTSCNRSSESIRRGGSFLRELILDPPEATSAEAVPRHLDEDYLVLSTIHSAKVQEWAVFVLNVIDGCVPSDMAGR